MFCIYSSYAQSVVMKAMAYLMLISPVGGDLVPQCPDVCVQKRRTWVLFRLQGSEMSEKISLKINLI